jgi:hypothetical protein
VFLVEGRKTFECRQETGVKWHGTKRDVQWGKCGYLDCEVLNNNSSGR